MSEIRMDDEKVFLKQNVLMEPLFNQWYAWPHLIPPASAAMYIAHLQLAIMRSYIKSPQIHAAAVKNPAMLGGPFIDFEGKRVEEVKALMHKTIAEQARMIELADAIKALDDLLRKEARGFSLESLYEKVPSMLKGYVELVYDLNNHPSIRFIEGLLYTSPFYDVSSQSILLSLIEQDHRSFVLSTPRLADETHLQISVPFNHEVIDELFKMRSAPQTFGYIKDALGVETGDEQLFRTFFTTEQHHKASSSDRKYDGESVRIRYFSHASVLLETRDICIFTDPSVSYEYDGCIPRYTFMDLPDVIDYVLITHAHQDHVMLEMLLQLRHKIKNIVVPKNSGGNLADPSLKMIFKQLGFRNVLEIDEMEAVEFEGGTITGLPFFGEHSDLNIRSKTAFLVQLAGHSIVCAADSNNLEPMLYEHIQQAIGDIDVMFIGMECDGAPLSWVYGPLLTQPFDRKMDQSRRLSGSNFLKAFDLISRTRCRQVYVYAMGQEPWLNHIMCLTYSEDSPQITESDELVEECRKRGIIAERLFGQKEMFL
jgi:L-ascorbate metabolism protein UlaG (beta-lactamase superfamily)